MATVYHQLDVLGATPSASNAATITTILLAAASEPIPALAFDASTDEFALFRIDIRSYGSGNLTLTSDWTSPSATSGDVVISAEILAYTPDTDSGALSGEAFATANTVTDTHLGTNAGRVMRASITISNLDSLANNDIVWLRLSRDANAAGDTMAGDMYWLGGTLSYSDT